jgi:hypothetical protein
MPRHYARQAGPVGFAESLNMFAKTCRISSREIASIEQALGKQHKRRGRSSDPVPAG